jgi:hypothetical protein
LRRQRRSSVPKGELRLTARVGAAEVRVVDEAVPRLIDVLECCRVAHRETALGRISKTTCVQRHGQLVFTRESVQRYVRAARHLVL